MSKKTIDDKVVDAKVKKPVFDIWSEGYRATGESAGAHYHGYASGINFEDACRNFFKEKDDKRYFDPKRMTYWGCKLVAGEDDARRSFG